MFLPRRSPLLALLTTLLITITTTTALPHREGKRYPKSNRDTTAKNADKFDLSTLQVPLSNGTTSLPPPSGTLKAITLGLGTQNYTCKAISDSPPELVGAKAALFDLSPFLPWLSPFLALVPQKALATDIDVIKGAAAVLGSHIFDGSGTPCFSLGEVGDLKAKKVPGADLVAPKPSVEGGGDSGKGGGKAKDGVNWLKLMDKGGSEGVSQVYRVDTAGGKPPKRCEKVGDVEVEYAALYYFYEG